MIQVYLDNSMCSIHGLSPDHFKKLRKILSYTDESFKGPAYGSYNRFNRVSYLINKKGEFPTGLYYLVQEYLDKNRLSRCLEDKRKIPTTGVLEGLGDNMEDLLGYSPYPEQSEAADAAIRVSRGIIVAPTGVGKSLIAAEIVRKLKVPTLIVVPRLGLKTQLIADLTRAFGYGWVGELGPKGEKRFEVTVENVDGLDPKRLADGFDCVIIDEFHRSAAVTYRSLNNKAWKNIYFKFGLTATPFRNNAEEKLLLESVLSKVIYEVPYATAIEKGYITPMETFFYEIPPLAPKTGRQKPKAAEKFLEVYKEQIVEREDRNLLIADLTESLLLQDASTLVLVKQIDHGERIQKILSDRGHDVPFAKGDNKTDQIDNAELVRGFNAREFPVLIGTVGVLGEGIDSRPAEYIILAGGGKSKSAFMQNLGRGFRKFKDKETAKIIMFNDTGHKWFREHFRRCMDYLKEEYGITPTKLEQR